MPDIDIDVADRSAILQHIAHIPAAIHRNRTVQMHNTGVYVNPIPHDPLTGWANIDHQHAERYGFFKLDFLNMHVYGMVRNSAHLDRLVATTPDYTRLDDHAFFKQLVHVGNHYKTYTNLAEPLRNIHHLAMFLAIIRPGKKHLRELPWDTIADSVWDSTDTGYSFKKSHAYSYALLVQVHMNLLCELANKL